MSVLPTVVTQSLFPASLLLLIRELFLLRSFLKGCIHLASIVSGFLTTLIEVIGSPAIFPEFVEAVIYLNYFLYHCYHIMVDFSLSR
jgi:hypothetical protein